MAAIAGVLIVDYWLIRKKHLALGDLYRTRGVYTYAGGWNWRAVLATLAGCAIAWAGPVLARFGVVVDLLQTLYNYAWFVGFGTAALTYFALMSIAPPRRAEVVEAAG